MALKMLIGVILLFNFIFLIGNGQYTHGGNGQNSVGKYHHSMGNDTCHHSDCFDCIGLCEECKHDPECRRILDVILTNLTWELGIDELDCHQLLALFWTDFDLWCYQSKRHYRFCTQNDILSKLWHCGRSHSCPIRRRCKWCMHWCEECDQHRGCHSQLLSAWDEVAGMVGLTNYIGTQNTDLICKTILNTTWFVFEDYCFHNWQECTLLQKLLHCGEHHHCPVHLGQINVIFPPPTDDPTPSPTNRPTNRPTDQPTDRPTDGPTDHPTDRPTDTPTDKTTDKPTDKPTERPTKEPTPIDYTVGDDCPIHGCNFYLTSNQVVQCHCPILGRRLLDPAIPTPEPIGKPGTPEPVTPEPTREPTGRPVTLQPSGSPSHTPLTIFTIYNWNADGKYTTFTRPQYSHCGDWCPGFGDTTNTPEPTHER